MHNPPGRSLMCRFAFMSWRSCHGSCMPRQHGCLAQVLEPLGFSRHFFRTEVRNDTGSLVFLDFQQPVNLTTWNRCACRQHLEHPLVLISLQVRGRPCIATCSLIMTAAPLATWPPWLPLPTLGCCRRTLHLSSEQLPGKRACNIDDARQPYWRWQERPHGCAHRHYIQLPSPYYGQWRHSGPHRV